MIFFINYGRLSCLTWLPPLKQATSQAFGLGDRSSIPEMGWWAAGSGRRIRGAGKDLNGLRRVVGADKPGVRGYPCPGDPKSQSGRGPDQGVQVLGGKRRDPARSESAAQHAQQGDAEQHGRSGYHGPGRVNDPDVSADFGIDDVDDG